MPFTGEKQVGCININYVEEFMDKTVFYFKCFAFLDLFFSEMQGEREGTQLRQFRRQTSFGNMEARGTVFSRLADAKWAFIESYTCSVIIGCTL